MSNACNCMYPRVITEKYIHYHDAAFHVFQHNYIQIQSLLHACICMYLHAITVHQCGLTVDMHVITVYYICLAVWNYSVIHYPTLWPCKGEGVGRVVGCSESGRCRCLEGVGVGKWQDGSVPKYICKEHKLPSSESIAWSNQHLPLELLLHTGFQFAAKFGW